MVMKLKKHFILHTNYVVILKQIPTNQISPLTDFNLA